MIIGWTRVDTHTRDRACDRLSELNMQILQANLAGDRPGVQRLKQERDALRDGLERGDRHLLALCA